MDAWIPVVSAFIGGLCATVPLLIGIAVQVYIHLSDIRQKEKETRIQAREKWIERDITKTMDLIEKLLTLCVEIRGLNRRIESYGELKKTIPMTEEEAQAALKTHIEKADNLLAEITLTMDTMSGLVYSFDEAEITSNYLDLVKEATNSLPLKEDKDFVPMRQAAGRLQKALRDKLISIRE